MGGAGASFDTSSQQAGALFKQLDYKKGEQLRDWYHRHGISPGNLEPAIVPYYLLLVGPPTLIPFDFQYLLGIEYTVGRLDFDQASAYGRYAQSVVDYEQSKLVENTKDIVYWGTRHPNDPATGLSTSMLILPLANGVEGARVLSRNRSTRQWVISGGCTAPTRPPKPSC